MIQQGEYIINNGGTTEPLIITINAEFDDDELIINDIDKTAVEIGQAVEEGRVVYYNIWIEDESNDDGGWYFTMNNPLGSVWNETYSDTPAYYIEFQCLRPSWSEQAVDLPDEYCAYYIGFYGEDDHESDSFDVYQTMLSNGGGNLEPLNVTITVESDPRESGTSVGGDVDKTYDEIIEAINEGRNVYCFVKNDLDYYFTRNVCINDVVNYYDDGVLVYEAVNFVSFEFGDAVINSYDISISRGDEGTQSSTAYRRYGFYQ